jgi:outer membrane protein assembly factor BamA
MLAGWRPMLAALIALLALVASPAHSQSQDDPPLLVENLVCRGNGSTSCEFILSHLYLSAGDRVDEREIRQASLRLSWLRNFESVSIYLEKGSERGRANVVVEVQEASPITYEATLGLYSQVGAIGPYFLGRATHYNLFGEGKILDAQASRRVPVAGPLSRGTRVSLQYLDPHLFGSRRYFLSAGVWSNNQRREWGNDNLVDARQLSVDVELGRRFMGFAYVTGGYRFRPVSDVYVRSRQRDGSLEVRTDRNSGGPMAAIGWNTENDPYFPTQGLRTHLSYVKAFDDSNDWTLSFRKNWRFGGEGVWTLVYDTTDAISVQYSRLIIPGRLGIARRSMWYAGPFLRPYYNNTDGGKVREVGATAGVRFETKSWGIIHLYVFGSGFSTAGDD